MKSEEYIISCKNLSIGYKKTRIQTGLNLGLKKSEMLCLIGPNGCGKSTLIRSLAGLQDLLGGQVYIDGIKFENISYAKRAKLISLVLTEKINTASLTLWQTVATGRQPHTNWLGRLSATDKEKVNNAIAKVNLSHKRDRYFYELSDGEKQRCMIAKALAQDTPIIFLDEPTAHLDLPNKIDIMLLLRKLAKEANKTILLSSHELELAIQAADKIWMMNKDGIQQGIPEDLILDGKIQEVFGNERFFFNRATGNFSMNHPINKKVNFTGEGTDAFWTIRALNRKAFQVDDQAEISIRLIGNKHWEIIFKNQRKQYYSLQNLLFALEELYYH